MLNKTKMKQSIENYYFYDFVRHKIHSFKPANCGRAHCRCNPSARPEKCRAANLVNFHPQNASEVSLTAWTNIMTIFMNTVKCFVKISMQKLEIIQREVAKRINYSLPHHHFVFDFGFAGLMMLHLKSWFWMDRTHMIYFWQIGHSELSFDTACVDFMNGCIN